MQYIGGGIDAFTRTLGAMRNIQGRRLANKMQEARLKQLPGMLALRREEAQQRADVLPQQLQQALAAQHAQTGLTQARAPYTAAQTAHLQEVTKEMPQQLLLRHQQLAQMHTRGGPLFQLRAWLQTLSPVERATWRAQNPRMSTALTHGLMLQAAQQIGIPTTFQHQSVAALTPPQPAAAPGLPPQAPAPSLLPQALMGGAPQQPPGPPQGPPMLPGGLPGGAPSSVPPSVASAPPPLSEEALKQQRAAELVANQGLTTTQTRQQMESAQQVESFVNSPLFKKQMASAAQFAGLAGKGKAALAAAGQKSPQGYEDYLSFGHQTMTLLLNRIRSLDKMGATIEEGKKLHGMYSDAMGSLTSNPKQFIMQMHNLIGALGTMGKAVHSAGTPLFDVARAGGQQPASAEAGGALKIPAFSGPNPRAQFQSWFNQQSDQRKAQLYAQMRGK